MIEIEARDHRDGLLRRLHLDRGRVARVETIGEGGPSDLWYAPGFWDIQLNGRWGWSFSGASLTVDQVVRIVRAQAELGSARICPTLITASPEETLHGIRTIADAIRSDPLVDHMVVGLHLEGPWISEVDGYRGAHPLSAIRNPDWAEFERWFEAADGRIAIVTLAPERPGAMGTIRKLRERGVVVAIGHSAADGDILHKAVEAGATLSTHLGNGIVGVLPRHPNPIWRQAAEDRLSASFIADGHHVDPDTLRVLLRAKGLDRTILVSDFSPLAGLEPGVYGDWEVHPSGKIVVAGTPYLAGSNQSLVDGVNLLLGFDQATLTDRGSLSNPFAAVIDTVTRNPARLLGCDPPRLSEGGSADLVLFRRTNGVEIVESYVAGRRFAPSV